LHIGLAQALPLPEAERRALAAAAAAAALADTAARRLASEANAAAADVFGADSDASDDSDEEAVQGSCSNGSRRRADVAAEACGWLSEPTMRLAAVD
jgi:hypothetical protein